MPILFSSYLSRQLQTQSLRYLPVMLFKSLAFATVISSLPAVFACPDHDYHSHLKRGDLHIHKRAETGGVTWAYEASYDWARLSESRSMMN